LIFAEPRLLEQMDIKVFVDTPDDIRFIRRLRRDLAERGRTVESVIEQYIATVRPMHMQFVEPSKRHADVIIPEGGHNLVSIDLLSGKIRREAGQCFINCWRSTLSEDFESLIEAAKGARLQSVAPFSNFQVGAAVRTANGKVYTGCNVESASYGLTVCAERVAIWKALSEGERQFTELAVVADTVTLTPPCGTCRQIIWEFARDAAIVFANLNGESEEFHIADLLPRAFDARFLKKK
jgi:cytidine deaminase